jgi:cellulose biosynthesis protein BcsQ
MAGKLIAVGNLKGGVGKTTLAVSIACALAEHVADLSHSALYAYA